MFWLWVAVRVVSNPVSNVWQKMLTVRHVDPLVIIGTAQGVLSTFCVPVLWLGPLPPDVSFWTNVTLCTVLAVAGNVLLVHALKLSDLSVLGPINAWKSVISLIPGMLVLQEIPTGTEILGVVLIVLGSYGLVDTDWRSSPRGGVRGLLAERGVQLRMAALLLTAIEAVFLKQALVRASPLMTFAAWSVIGFAVASMAAMIFIRSDWGGQSKRVQRHWLITLALAVTTGLMQLSTLVVLAEFPVAPALALFQTSTLMTVLLGWQVFHEQHVVKRLAGAALMVAGAVIITIYR